MATTANATFTGLKLEPAFRADLATEISVQFPRSTTIARGTLLGEYTGAAANEVQTLTTSGTPTGGTFTLTFDGQTTSALAYNATAAAVQAALEALSNIGSGNVLCAGGALPTGITITFRNDLGNLNVPAITSTDSLTGGTSPATAIAQTTAGSGGPGTFGVYSNGGSGGLETAKAIASYDIITDGYGRVTFGNEVAAGQFAVKHRNAPVFISGFFKCEDLTGLDSNAVTDLGRLVRGTTTSGILRVS